MSNDAPASNVTESATCAPTSNLRKRCCRTLPAVPRPPSFRASTISARELCSAGYKPINRPVSSESAIANASTGTESAVAVPASIGRKFAARRGTSGTNCQARSAPRIPANKLSSTLSKTKSLSTLARVAPSAMRNEISRRRPVNLTSSRFATLLQAMSKTKVTAASSVAKPGRKFSVTSSGNALTSVPDHVWIAAQSPFPKTIRDHSDIGAFLFLRQKCAAANRAQAEHIEPIRCRLEDRNLKRIAKSGHRSGDTILTSKSVENGLPIAEMHETRRGEWEIDRLLLETRENVEQARWLLEGQAAQEQIIDQSKDGGVQPDPEREREQ